MYTASRTMRPCSMTMLFIRQKTSAAAQLAQGIDIETFMQSPQPLQRIVELENIRSRTNELDQRKLRQKEYEKMVKELSNTSSHYTLAERLPFKPPNPEKEKERSLRQCSSIDEVLALTSNSEQLAKEVLRLTWELDCEKRKNDHVLESRIPGRIEGDAVK